MPCDEVTAVPDYYDDPPDFGSWQERESWDSLPDFLREDPNVDMMHHLLFDRDISGDMRSGAFDAIDDYIRETYGIEWEDVFDWEDFRDWYDAA